MKHIKYLITFVFLLIGVTAASAQVIIECPPPPPCTIDAPCPLVNCPPRQPGVFTDPSWLKIDYHRVNVDIENQIAATHVDMQFTNQGEALAEGTFIFPLPQGAAVDQLTMWIDGQPIEAKILNKDEARGIYNEIVRQYRDPALLEYVGMNAVQANVFPIPPGDSRRIEIQYSQILEVDNGLINYVYPMNNAGVSQRLIDEMSIAVNVIGNDPISSIYSPSHNIAITRTDDDRGFRTGFESTNFVADGDFSLFYGISSDTINVNLLTYRESATDDGFFMLLVQPPVTIPDDQIIAKDVIVVLDQSGSMTGDKWEQAREAAITVLRALNVEDRFNVILFSTGWRVFSSQMEARGQAESAIDWIRGQEAVGGTDINGALTTALDMVESDRPTTVLFMTDGLATEGEVETQNILKNLEAASKPNVRIFTFGVGDDVDTFLLDAVVQDFRGTGSYVRPGERIDEKVASLYSKISAPVMTDIALDFGGMQIDWMYPSQLPDLFAGEQLTLVGRYRQSTDNTAITLRGSVNGQEQSFIYSNLEFPARAGGEPFISRLWATRRIGDLLNSIRLQGENQELIDSVVNLSVRYGIITPYTSFLIEEDDILSQAGRDRATSQFAEEAQGLAMNFTGSGAVAAADATINLQAAQAPMPQPTMSAPMSGSGGETTTEAERDDEQFGGRFTNPIQTINDKTFILQGDVWTDSLFTPDTMETQKIEFLSDAYFQLLEDKPELSDYFAVGERVIVVVEGVAYEITSAA
jgi:Ca-activated chloride channel homolog